MHTAAAAAAATPGTGKGARTTGRATRARQRIRWGSGDTNLALPSEDDRTLYVLVKARQAADKRTSEGEPTEYFTADTLSRLDPHKWAAMPMEHGQFTITGSQSHGRWLRQWVREDGSYVLLGRVETDTVDGKLLAHRIEMGVYPEVSMRLNVGYTFGNDKPTVDYRVTEVSFTRRGERGELEGVHGSTPVLAWLRGGEVRRLLDNILRDDADGSEGRRRAEPVGAAAAAGGAPAPSAGEGMHVDDKDGVLGAKSGQPAVSIPANLDRIADAPDTSRRGEKRTPACEGASAGTQVDKRNTAAAAAGGRMKEPVEMPIEDVVQNTPGGVTSAMMKVQHENTELAERLRAERDELLKLRAEKQKRDTAYNTLMESSVGNKRAEIESLLKAYVEHMEQMAGKESADLINESMQGDLTRAMTADDPLEAVNKMHTRVEGIVQSARLHRQGNAEFKRSMANSAAAQRSADQMARYNEFSALRNRQTAALAAMPPYSADGGAGGAPVEPPSTGAGAAGAAEVDPRMQQQQQQQQHLVDPFNGDELAMRAAELDTSGGLGGIATSLLSRMREPYKPEWTAASVRELERGMGDDGMDWFSRVTKMRSMSRTPGDTMGFRIAMGASPGGFGGVSPAGF